MCPDRDEGGAFASKVTDDDVLRALRAHDEPVATAGDLAEALGVTSETVRRHLTSLYDRGQVGKKRAGANAVVWWIVDVDESPVPAAPLQTLVGLLDEDAAARARERSEEWREAFDREANAGGA